ncbi:MAG: ATP-grasp domain-containing protein [Anaerolineae bacterium]
MKIFVTGIGGPAGRNVSQLLIERGHEVVGADMRSVCLPGVAAFHQAPPARAAGYLEWLDRHTADCDWIIPTVQEELPIVARGRSQLHCPVLISPELAINIAHDKWLTVLTLQEADVPCPRFVLPSALICPPDVADYVGWPCLSKPRVGRGGRFVTIYDTPADFHKLRSLDDSYIMQEFAPGIEYTANLFVPNYNNITVVVLEKEAMREGRTGNATAVKRVDAPDIAEVAVGTAQALGLYGPVDMDIRRDANGNPLLLEVNARFGANIAHAPEVFDAMLHALLPLYQQPTNMAEPVAQYI